MVDRTRCIIVRMPRPFYFKAANVLPKKISDIPENFNEDDYNLYITKVDYSSKDVTIEIALDVEDVIEKKWTIRAIGHRKNSISFDMTATIKIENENPLLWEFNDIQSELYFKGECINPSKLFYELYIIHKRVYKSYQHFAISFGNDFDISSRFKYANGFLTKGPRKLLEIYAECLKQNGLDYTIV